MKLMVIDGNSIVNRAYYGIRPLTTRDGLYTHAVFGFLTTLLRLKGEENPDAVCVTFDVHAPTFRHEASEAYKATRKGMPEELRMQMPVLKEVLDSLNIPRYELAGWEADDLIGTISRKCEAAGWECVVVTGDKDSLQLITEHTKVKLVSTRMGQTTTKDMDEAAFREQYGFDPIHMIDLKALMGDTSDNIPGVPGIGEKTAMALVQKYGSIDALYAKMPDVEAKPAALRKLQEGEDSARQSYWLATIVTDAPLDFRPEDNLVRAPGPEAYGVFLKLEFTKLIDKFGLTPGEAPATAAPAEETVTVEQVTDPARAAELLELWRKADHVSVLALPDLTGAVVVCGGEGGTLTAELFFEKYQGDWNALLNALFSADIPKVSHNVKDLTRRLLESGSQAEGFIFDTALAAYLLDATAGSYDLGRLFVAYYNTELPKPIHLEPDAFSLLGDSAAAEAAFDSYATAVDYDPRAKITREFFATVQNKMHYAVHAHTAAEVIYERVDNEKPNVGMTSFKGDYVTKDDVRIAKNYLTEKEIAKLNLLVSQFLDYAEYQALSENAMTMAQWVAALDEQIKGVRAKVLVGKGHVTHEEAMAKAEEEFNAYRVRELRQLESDFDKAMKKFLKAGEDNG